MNPWMNPVLSQYSPPCAVELRWMYFSKDRWVQLVVAVSVSTWRVFTWS